MLNPDVESRMDKVRDYLTHARAAERTGDTETAQAWGARAANVLSGAVAIQRKVIPLGNKQE